MFELEGYVFKANSPGLLSMPVANMDHAWASFQSTPQKSSCTGGYTVTSDKQAGFGSACGLNNDLFSLVQWRGRGKRQEPESG